MSRGDELPCQTAVKIETILHHTRQPPLADTWPIRGRGWVTPTNQRPRRSQRRSGLVHPWYLCPCCRTPAISQQLSVVQPCQRDTKALCQQYRAQSKPQQQQPGAQWHQCSSGCLVASYLCPQPANQQSHRHTDKHHSRLFLLTHSIKTIYKWSNMRLQPPSPSTTHWHTEATINFYEQWHQHNNSFFQLSS